MIYSVQGMDHQSFSLWWWVVLELSLGSRKSKKIDLYSDYTENKLQVLTFTSIISVCISLQHWINIHHRLANQPRHSVSPVVTYVYEYKGGLVEEMTTILFTSTAS